MRLPAYPVHKLDESFPKSKICDTLHLSEAANRNYRSAVGPGADREETRADMAHKGIGFFDSRGHFFKSPEDATLSDLAALLGKIGDGESLAPGIAHLMFDRRTDIERIFAEHDEMKAEQEAAIDAEAKVTRLEPRAS